MKTEEEKSCGGSLIIPLCMKSLAQRGFFFYPSEDTQLGVSLLQPPFQQHLQAALSTADLILQQWVQSPGWVA